MTPSARTPNRWLVVGSYPPVPGPAAGATVAAVRRAWASGAEVVVVSPRPSAAPYVLRSARGRAVSRRLVRLGQQHGCGTLVLGLERGWPTLGRARAGGEVLGAALSRFGTAELLVTGELGLAIEELGSLWRAAAVVTVTSGGALAAPELAARLEAAGARQVRCAAPDPGTLLVSWASVGPTEPGDLLVSARARRALGAAARKVLGPRAPAVRAQLARLVATLRRSAPDGR